MKNVVMFTAKWCGHCVNQKRAFKEVGLNPTYVDIDEEIYDAYKNLMEVNELPTIVILEGLKPIKTFVGETDVKEIKEALNEINQTII